MRILRAGIPALLLAASAATFFTACGKAGGADATAGAQLPSVRTLADADRQLHTYLLDVTPIHGHDNITRAGSVLPHTVGSTACSEPGQSTHVVAETVIGAPDGYATQVVGALRHRGWHIVGWNDDTPDGSRVTGAIQAGYRVSVLERFDTVDVTIETPCLQGEPIAKRSDFPDNFADARDV
ncbi:hypothetical protein [Streptomyces sp. NPDC049040]|uniref:hypothetical protein n=1 Tax=Streptomyces sp. NPDC049040 TaxID=3365593 RepID=UPI003711095D